MLVPRSYSADQVRLPHAARVAWQAGGLPVWKKAVGTQGPYRYYSMARINSIDTDIVVMIDGVDDGVDGGRRMKDY